VKKDRVAHAGKHCRDDEGLAVGGKSDVTDESLVKNLVNGFAVVHGAIRFAYHARPTGGREWFGHRDLKVAHGAELIAGAESA
jgi:hypothetical protein